MLNLVMHTKYLAVRSIREYLDVNVLLDNFVYNNLAYYSSSQSSILLLYKLPLS